MDDDDLMLAVLVGLGLVYFFGVDVTTWLPSFGVADVSTGGVPVDSAGHPLDNEGHAIPPIIRPDYSETVIAAKATLERQGADLSGPCGALSIVKLAARMIGDGAGLLYKPGGNNCDERATDIIAYPDGGIYDVLGDGGNANVPGWAFSDNVDPGRYRSVDG